MNISSNTDSESDKSDPKEVEIDSKESVQKEIRKMLKKKESKRRPSDDDSNSDYPSSDDTDSDEQHIPPIVRITI